MQVAPSISSPVARDTVPERLRGEQAQPAADLFSLGATLFTAVEGRPPFQKGDAFATITAVIEDVQAPLLRAGPLRSVIEGLPAKDPNRRLSADEARVALRAIQRGIRRRGQWLPAGRDAPE
jgi:eukaryotic-like serine/threonine-protein kinase